MDAYQRRALALALVVRRRRRRAHRRPWVHDTLRSREELGEFRLVRELQFHSDRFEVYFRLRPEEFDDLLSRVGPAIRRMDTNFRRAITPKERLAVCLRYLATGDSYHTIASSYRMGISTVAGIVPEACQAIWDSLVQEFLPVPTAAHWRDIANDFYERWQFPNCIGAIDGKHIVIQAPPNAGSQYYKYKGAHSVVLLAVVDANYLFRVVDIGAFGRNSDRGTLAASSLGQALGNNALDLPQDVAITGAEHLGPLPHVFVGDEAFPLRVNLLRPYPGRDLDPAKATYNHRLSRARRVVENAFGILAGQWRIYHRVIGVRPENVDAIVKATVALHNFLRVHVRDPAPVSRAEAPAFEAAGRLGANNAALDAIAVREAFTSYFTTAPVP